MNDFVIKLPLAMQFYLIGLIYRNSRMSCVCLAELVQVAHDRLYRVLYLSFPYSRRLWEWVAANLVSAGGYLIIDDTTWTRFGKKLEATSFVWDSTLGKRVFGMQVVLLIWTNGSLRIPVGIRIWQKGGKSKVKLAGELFCEARRRGLTPMYVLFDSWYAAESLLNLLSSFGWQYITKAKKNRLLDKVRLDKTFRHRFGRRNGNLRRIRHTVLIVKDGKKYYLTNAVRLSSAEVKRFYRVRQQIEEVFRLLKQEFGWGRCRAAALQSQKAHLHLGLYAFCLVQNKAIEKQQTIYAFKQDLFREAIPTQTQFLKGFTAFA
jgi:putative transposase